MPKPTEPVRNFSAQLVRLLIPLIISAGGMGLAGCASSYQRTLVASTPQVYTKIFGVDQVTVWQATLKAVKNIARVKEPNPETGIISTEWTENTSERNFTDSFANAETVMSAKFRFRIQVIKGIFEGKPSAIVKVQKEQIVESDILEGWRYADSDGVEENTLLYRVGRMLWIENRIAKLDKSRVEKALTTDGIGESPAGSSGTTSAGSTPSPPPPSSELDSLEPPPLSPSSR
jgi:hypothetical protein